MAKSKNKIQLFSVSPHGNTNRSLLWCDDHWYETTEGRNLAFTKEQVETIKKQLPNHFVYKATISDENGVVEEWSAFKEKAPQKANKPTTKGFKIKLCV